MNRFPKRTAALLVCLSILGLFSLLAADIAGAATETDLSKVKAGMLRTDVQKIMGTPPQRPAPAARGVRDRFEPAK